MKLLACSLDTVNFILVNITTVITELIFFSFAFSFWNKGRSKERSVVILRKKKTSMAAWRHL